MKFTLSWLKEHLETAATVGAVADTLTRIGLEVEAVVDPAARFTGFRTARIVSAGRHPHADKLQLLSVDAGDGPVQVVCGAPNARAGLIGVFGATGAVVPATGMVLKVTVIRGVESNGMMCSGRELDMGDDHDGIIELPSDAPIGMPYADYAQLSDPVFDVAITPNRQDCMGVRGIARDLAAAGLGTLRPLCEVYRAASLAAIEGAALAPDIGIDDLAGCPAFHAQAVSGLTNGASPPWLQRKLTAIGQKPISVLVDITNLLSVDLGRPLHVYDRSKLQGRLTARKARDGEQIVALNGKTYTLDDSMTVIADDAVVHDIGGIMGGAYSGVGDDTTDVLIECAYFDPAHIARTGQSLTLTSDARQRFERGVDPAFLDTGLAIATWLVTAHCGGTASTVVRAGQPPTAPRTIAYDPAFCRELAGLDVADTRQRAILDALGCDISDDWQITVPSWRRDIEGPPDIVEEVVRIVGLDQVPSTPLPRADGVAKPTATAAQMIERTVRRTAAARGLHEAITWSFLSSAHAAAFGDSAWSLANPISEDMKVMRPTMLAGLLAAAARNANHGAETIRLFEIGRRYLAAGERASVGIVLGGNRTPRGWASGKAQMFDAYDAKAEALALLAAAGAPIEKLQVMGEAGAHFHPGQSGTLRLGPKTILASFGALHPATAKLFDVRGAVVAAEIYLDAVPLKRKSNGLRSAYAPPALQAVIRDFAFLVPRATPADTVMRAIRMADKDNITGARLFDIFTGAGVADGYLSLAIEVTLQPREKSYAEAELKAMNDLIVAAALKAGATLRG